MSTQEEGDKATKGPTILAAYTDGSRILHTLLVKHYNDLLDRQSSERGKNEVTYFYVGDHFCIHLGSKFANFQEKIFADISGRKLQTLYSSNVTHPTDFYTAMR